MKTFDSLWSELEQKLVDRPEGSATVEAVMPGSMKLERRFWKKLAKSG
jgi:hypothetical protein